MENSAEQIVSRELRSTERLHWSGRPKQGLLLRSSDLFQIPIGIFSLSFSIFWLHGAIGGGAPASFWCFGIPFVFVGLYLAIGRFFVDSKLRSRTYYGVTSERIIIVSHFPIREVKSLDLKTLPEIFVTEKINGVGTITFGPINPMATAYAGTPWPGMRNQGAPCFDFIDGAKQVYDLIRDIREKAR